VNFISSKTGRVFEADWVPAKSPSAAPIVRTPPHVAASNDADTWIALAVAGFGIVQAPLAPEVRARLAGGELRMLMPGWRSEPLPSSVLYPAARHLPARVRLFAYWLVELLYAAEAETASRFLSETEARALSTP
jgi:DNA-binding transcriptional LysR family regulator